MQRYGSHAARCPPSSLRMALGQLPWPPQCLQPLGPLGCRLWAPTLFLLPCFSALPPKSVAKILGSHGYFQSFIVPFVTG